MQTEFPFQEIPGKNQQRKNWKAPYDGMVFESQCDYFYLSKDEGGFPDSGASEKLHSARGSPVQCFVVTKGRRYFVDGPG